MRILIWTSPWILQGGTVFFAKNSYENHLLRQANTLAQNGHDVSLVVPDAYKPLHATVNSRIKRVDISVQDGINQIGGWFDPSQRLYDGNEELAHKLSKWLGSVLQDKFDAILTWETPVPFLRLLYPDALVIEQMPGGFARAPYPHTVVFDSNGLYRNSSLGKFVNNLAPDLPFNKELILDFRSKSKQSFKELMYRSFDDLRSATRSDKVCLLPLQISDHYAFRSDTGFNSQREYIFNVIKSIPSDVGVYITEYISKHTSEAILDQEYLSFLKRYKTNIAFEESSRELSAVSQHLLQSVDMLAVATSGLALQSLIWDVDICAFGNSNYQKLDFRNNITRENKDQVLSFALERNQPLASKITADGSFLTSLLEELISKNVTANVVDLPRFEDIDPKYNTELLAAFKHKEAKSIFLRKGFVSKQTKADQFSDQLEQIKPKIVSFDLFDTLISRPFEQPADVYRYIEKRLSETNLRHFNFADKRLLAETEARRKSTKDEITLDDIYDELRPLTGMSYCQLNEVKKIEIDIEVDISMPRELGRQLWDAAVATGVNVVITSDMYLPESAILRIIEKHGYREYDRLLLSSSLMKTKKAGTLFSFLLSEYNVGGAEVIHVGDNPKTDVKPAQDKGITAFHLPRPETYLWENAQYKQLFRGRKPIESLSRSAMCSMVAKKVFADPKHVSKATLFNSDPLNIGYCALGPLMFAFTQWIREECIEKGRKDVYFLSREGKIISDLFEIMEAAKPSGIRHTYLYASRRATRIPQLFGFEDILDVTKAVIDRNATVRSLLENRFGLTIDVEIMQCARDCGLSNLDSRVSERNLGKVLELLEGIKDSILETAKVERENYQDYLKSVEFGEHGTPTVVDVGWNANMQGALSRISGKSVNGMYFATLEKAQLWNFAGLEVDAYFRNFASVTKDSPILSNRLLFEYMLCDTTPSVKNVAKNERGEFTPVFVVPTETEARVSFVSAIHSGIREYAKDQLRIFNAEAFDFSRDKENAQSVINLLFSSPVREDATLFEGHVVEDLFSGSTGIPLVRKSISNPGYWRAGSNALSVPKPPRPVSKIPKVPSLRAKLVLAVATPVLSRYLAPKQASELRRKS
ncbi:HAD family hydrolase [Pseudovibrio denitrificans]|uniref:HAD family hydrolase n=1 Tax=Pseudovibrio denitrificans TaxID=258256 RepID=UPI0039BF3F66